MSRTSISSLIVLFLVALAVNLARPTASESSYMWGPAVQVTASSNGGSNPNVAPQWGEADSFEIHQVYRECYPNCKGENSLGWYLNVGSAGWAAAATSLLTGLQSNGNTLRAQDIDMEVDSGNNPHVVFEVFFHKDITAYDPTFNDGAYPMVGYKRRGRPAWSPDTAIVITAPWVAGNCLPRRDHGPQLFIERGRRAFSRTCSMSRGRAIVSSATA